jgi:hypothetical protein
MDEALEVDILAASLKLEGGQSADMMGHLAKKLQMALPDNVTITRGGWLLSSKRPVKDILVRFENNHFQLTKDQYGPVTPRQIKVVRGVALKTNEVSFDEWIANLAQEMAELAGRSTQAREAMSRLVQ